MALDLTSDITLPDGRVRDRNQKIRVCFSALVLAAFWRVFVFDECERQFARPIYDFGLGREKIGEFASSQT